MNPRHRVPAGSTRDTRPPARFIEDNSVLCGHRLWRCHADCFPLSPRRHANARCVAVTAPACRHPSRQPSAPPLNEYGVAKPRPPTHPRMLAPFHSHAARDNTQPALLRHAGRAFDCPDGQTWPEPSYATPAPKVSATNRCCTAGLHRENRIRDIRQRFKKTLLSVQQRATQKVRNCAFYGRFVSFE